MKLKSHFKKPLLALFAVVTLFSSCLKKDDANPVEVVENQQKAWTYSTMNWSTAGGTSTGWINCYNAQGTNQTAKRAIFTISDSPRPVDVTVQVSTNGCPNTPGQQVASFTVPAGRAVSRIIDVSGYPTSESRLRVNIRPSTSTSGSFSGIITYGYDR